MLNLNKMEDQLKKSNTNSFASLILRAELIDLEKRVSVFEGKINHLPTKAKFNTLNKRVTSLETKVTCIYVKLNALKIDIC